MSPTRSAGGSRLYSDADVDRLVADGDALGVPRREMADRLAARLRRLARAAKEGR